MKRGAVLFLAILLVIPLASAFSLCDLFPFFCGDKGVTGNVFYGDSCSAEGDYTCFGDERLICAANLTWTYWEYCPASGKVCQNGECVSAEECDSSHLSLCTDESGCTGAGGYWYNSICNSEPESLSQCSEGAIPSSGCLCQGIEKTSGYCCYSYLGGSPHLVWTNVPCTQTCTSVGGVCCSGLGSDCNSWSGQWATDCQGYICCTGTCTGKIYHPLTASCSELGGETCNQNTQTCQGTEIGAGDTAYCCQGTCYPPEDEMTCSQQYGAICTATQECSGYFMNASDTDRCCSTAYCYTPGTTTTGYCGDGICNSTNETIANCAVDCNVVAQSCGDGTCNLTERLGISSCPADCNTTTTNDGTTPTTTTPTTPTTTTPGEVPTIPAEQLPPGEEQITEETEAVVLENGTITCSQGCLLEDACLPIGVRKKIEGTHSYCSYEILGDSSVAYIWSAQRAEDQVCDNSYECRSNFCADDKCIKQGLLTRIINWFKNLFGLFGSEEESAVNETSNQTCYELAGAICNTDQSCNGIFLNASDTDYCCSESCYYVSAVNYYCGDGVCNEENETIANCAVDCNINNATNSSGITIE